jgi:hypothetical protein
MTKKPTYEELVPDDVRELAASVGLPEPTWYQGRTNGHGEPSSDLTEQTSEHASPTVG